MPTSSKDRDVLRRLAARVAEIAALPVQAERTRLWKDFNALRPHRPMVLAFPEGGWRELVPDATAECEGGLLRAWEMHLRRTIYAHEHIHDDQPITGFFNVGWAVGLSDYGLTETYSRTDELGSYRWDAPVKSAADLSALHRREVSIDRAETARRAEIAEEAFGDLLRVRVHGSLWWSLGMTWALIRLRGLQQVMLDTYENPALLHRLMALLRDSTLHELDTYEKEGILSLNNGPDDYVGSGGLGATDELPAPGFTGRVRLEDMWALGESQEFVGIGPAQYYEFALEYQLPILNKFGRVCYGCCEPLDGKFDLIKEHLPRLRRVSVSPWCDRSVAAEKLGSRYIFSWKPNPAAICGPAVDYGAVERGIRETLEIARGCCLEMIMKDTHTFQGDPERISRWTEIASRLAAEAA